MPGDDVLGLVRQLFPSYPGSPRRPYRPPGVSPYGDRLSLSWDAVIFLHSTMSLGESVDDDGVISTSPDLVLIWQFLDGLLKEFGKVR